MSTGGIGGTLLTPEKGPISPQMGYVPSGQSCARARAKLAQQQEQQQQGRQGPEAASPVPRSFLAPPQLPGSSARPEPPPAKRPAASSVAGAGNGMTRVEKEHRETARVLAAVAAQLAGQGENGEHLLTAPSPDLAPLCQNLRPLKISLPPQQDDAREAANLREISLRLGVAELPSPQQQLPGRAPARALDVSHSGTGRSGAGAVAPHSGGLTAAAASRQSAARALFNVNQAAASCRQTVRTLASTGTAPGTGNTPAQRDSTSDYIVSVVPTAMPPTTGQYDSATSAGTFTAARAAALACTERLTGPADSIGAASSQPFCPASMPVSEPNPFAHASSTEGGKPGWKSKQPAGDLLDVPFLAGLRLSAEDVIRRCGMLRAITG
jgi:hypothetical protein